MKCIAQEANKSLIYSIYRMANLQDIENRNKSKDHVFMIDDLPAWHGILRHLLLFPIVTRGFFHFGLTIFEISKILKSQIGGCNKLKITITVRRTNFLILDNICQRGWGMEMDFLSYFYIEVHGWGTLFFYKNQEISAEARCF